MLHAYICSMSVISSSHTEWQPGRPMPSLCVVMVGMCCLKNRSQGCFPACFSRIFTWDWQLKASFRNKNSVVPKLLGNLQSLLQLRADFELELVHLVNGGSSFGISVILYLPYIDNAKEKKVGKFFVVEFAHLTTVSHGGVKSDCFTWKLWFMLKLHRCLSALGMWADAGTVLLWEDKTTFLMAWSSRTAALLCGTSLSDKTDCLEMFCCCTLVVSCDG